MRRVVHRSGLSFGLLVLALPAPARAQSAAAPSIYAASLAEANAGTEEISTAELQRLLAGGNVVLLDTRPHLEWAISHIPGALNVAPKPGMPMSLYTSDAAEVGRLVGGDRTRPLVLYCNGPFCGKSRRVAEELLAAGHTNVRRYQLGAPVWRALGGIMVIAPEGVRHVAAHDGTAVWLDARDAAEFQAGSLPGAKHLPRGQLELRINEVLPDPTARVVTVCEFGKISTLAAATLRDLGFLRASALDGGMKAWRDGGLPVEPTNVS
jgi:rhodanese-related sulfurtransferase